PCYHPQRPEFPRRKLPSERLKPFLERRRGIREIQENKTFPKTQPRRFQRIISLIESRRLIHVRRAKQSPIQRVRPRVIRALNRCGVTILLFAKSRPAVTANVVERADRRSLILPDDQTFAGYFRKEIVARFGELALMADQNPPRREYLLQLFSKNLR